MATTRRSAAKDTEPAAKRAKTAPAFSAGDSIPEGIVVNQDGEDVNLAEKFADSVLVLFSYPKASTPGCTKQTNGFGEIYQQFKDLGAEVYGISADSPKAQTNFKEKTGVDFDLLSDPQYTLLGPLNAKKNPKGVIRCHWVFSNGKAVAVEHLVKPGDSPELALKSVKELGKTEDQTNENEPDKADESESKSASNDSEKIEEQTSEDKNDVGDASAIDSKEEEAETKSQDQPETQSETKSEAHSETTTETPSDNQVEDQVEDVTSEDTKEPLAEPKATEVKS